MNIETRKNFGGLLLAIGIGVALAISVNLAIGIGVGFVFGAAFIVRRKMTEG